MRNERHIVAFGGHVMEPDEAANDFLLELTGERDPRVLFVPTASGDSDYHIARYHRAFPASRCRASHLKLFAIPPRDVREVVLEHDLVFVGGGNTANMLAVWRVHRLDEVLRDAWEQGVVLAGTSAGAICWFEAGVTDSYRAALDGIDCLGFLRGSNCPHYDGEETRRPAYHRLVAAGFPAGIAVDDGCALHFVGDELADVIAATPGARAYAVERVDGEVRETPIAARPLG